MVKKIMKTKSFHHILVLTVLLFSGCKNADSTPVLPFIDFSHKWTDVSNTDFNFSSVNDFSYSDKTIHAKKQSGTETGNTLRNFLLSSLGRQNVTGFEAQVKIGNNMKSCGFEFSGNPSYSSYWFMIKQDGSFTLKLHDYRTGSKVESNVFDLNKDNSIIKINDFNTIKMESLASGKDAAIYINGLPVCTLNDLIFTKGTFAIYYQAEKGTYSRTKTADAEYKILSIQKNNQ